MCLAQGPQRSDAGEAHTCCPSVWSQALDHRATALPKDRDEEVLQLVLTLLLVAGIILVNFSITGES